MIMKIKKHWKKIILVIIILLIIFIFNSRLIMLKLPTGEYIESLTSPNDEYTLKAYRYSGGATMDWSVRVEIVNNNTNKVVNIYWKYHEKDANMRWIDNENVEINGIKLNIYKDYYNE